MSIPFHRDDGSPPTPEGGRTSHNSNLNSGAPNLNVSSAPLAPVIFYQFLIVHWPSDAPPPPRGGGMDKGGGWTKARGYIQQAVVPHFVALPLAQARPRSQKSGQNGGSTPTPCLDKAVHARDICDSQSGNNIVSHG